MRLARLDGVRALAVGFVFALHELRFRPGWVGVDLFFVLSGFLITGILRRDRQNVTSWRPFYIKRATRILPPLLICFALATLLHDFKWKQLGIYYVFFGANIADARFNTAGRDMSILWSLAVEEHFYLFWPIAVRFLRRNQLIWLLLSVLCLEPVVRGIATPYVHSWWAMYVLTPFRLDSISAGSLLALLTEDEGATEVLARFSGPMALCSILVFCFCFLKLNFYPQSNSLLFNSLGYSLTSLSAASTVSYIILHPDALICRVLANKIAVFIGTVSYGIYLFHLLVIRAVQLFLYHIHYDHLRTFTPVIVALTVLLSWVSFRFYESPIIRFGHRKARALQAPST